MKAKHWLLLLLLFLPLVLRAETRTQLVTFYSYPPGATVFQEADTQSGWEEIGNTVAEGTPRAGLPVRVDSAGSTVRIKLELPGHEPIFDSLQTDSDRYPIQGAATLSPTSGRAALRDFVVYKPGQAAGVGLLMGLGVYLGWAAARRKQTERRRAEFFAELGARGESQSFGDYWIVKAVGQGGMGSIRLVVPKDRLEHSEVRAMKTLPVEPVPAEVIRRFKREIAISKDLDHPNIVKIYDYGDLDGEFYLVMEYLQGGDLRDLINHHAARGEMLPLKQALQYLREISEALAYAHERDITHRDLKPENVLLDSSGHARLADFGLARRTVESKLITRTGVVGTVSHLAPEQIQGSTEPSIDQYAFGVLAYELLTLKLPFGELGNVGDPDKLLVFLQGHLTRAPESLRRHRPNLPEAVDLAVLRMLEKDPGKRYPTIREAYQALDQATRTSETSP